MSASSFTPASCDVAIVFSHETDLVPLIEMLVRLKGAGSVETASWAAEHFNQRIRTKSPVHHHAVSQAVFDRVERRVKTLTGSSGAAFRFLAKPC